MRRRRAPVALAAAVLVAAGAVGGELSAQTTAPGPPLGPEIYASATVLAPLSGLSTVSESFATEVSSALGASAGGVWWLDRWLGVGIHGVWEPAALRLRPSTFTGVVPDDLGDADYAAALANVVLRLPLSGPASLLEPFVAAGGGIRDLQLDPVASPEAGSATDVAGTVAAGAAVRVWEPLALRFEVRDLISDYDETVGEGGTQHDVLVSVGLSLRP